MINPVIVYITMAVILFVIVLETAKTVGACGVWKLYRPDLFEEEYCINRGKGICDMQCFGCEDWNKEVSSMDEDLYDDNGELFDDWYDDDNVGYEGLETEGEQSYEN